jgi:5-methylcytosine-specific restriction endonuclease McrA
MVSARSTPPPPTCSAVTRTTTVISRDRHGRIWDVGHANGDPSRAQRAAVIARDGGCVGCGAPAYRCQIHHVRFRRKGGKTVVANLVLVCWSCHHGIHHLDWTITGDPHTGFAINRRPTTTATGGDPPRHSR